MFLPELCIRRPVLATVMNLFVILLGVIAYNRLAVREYPNIDEPIVTVQTDYLGASAEIVETQITKPLEDSLAGIEGIEVMSSISRAESSQIAVRFKISREPDAAANDVRDRVARVRDRLPEESDDPVVAKIEADAQPIIYLAFTSDRLSPMEITDYADRNVKDTLQNIAGVANVNIFGERRKSMRLWLDPQRLAAARLTPSDIEAALRRQNVEIPAGRIEGKTREFTVLSETDLRTPEQFNNIILRREGVNFLRFKDVGYAEIAPEEERRTARFKGDNAVALGIVKQSTSNPLEVSRSLRKLMPDILATLPEGMKLDIAYDSSIFIDRSIQAVYETIFEAIILVLAVIFFFLRSVKATLIPLITIPISIVGVFFMMYLFDYSLNTLTLLAFVLAVGLVVDDAIVVLENIYRHIEDGMKPMAAALQGGREIGFAIIAMTLTLAAVYAPVAFTGGKAGRLFSEFALTLAMAVVISGFTALSLTPMLCSRLLSTEKKHGVLYTAIEKILQSVTAEYKRSLQFALRHRKIVLTAGAAIAAANILLLNVLQSELAPVEDRGVIVTIAVAPEGSTVGYMADWMQKLEPVFAAVPEVEKFFVVAGMPTVSRGIAFVRLKDWEKRDRKQQTITAEIGPKIFMAAQGIMAFAVNPPSLGGSARSKPVSVNILTNGTYAELDKVVTALMGDLATYPGLINLDTDLKMNKPQIAVSLDRDKAAAVGIDVDAVGQTLQTLLGGRKVTRFKDRGEQYDVIVQTKEDLRSRPQDLTDIYVRNEGGEMIKLSNLLTFRETVAPSELNHFNQRRTAEITGSPAPGHTLGEVLTHIEKRAKEILPANMSLDYNGESREFKNASASIAAIFVVSLAFIYLVLAAQFESFNRPFIIMLSVPLSMAGALFMLYVTGGTMNVYSEVGLVTLIGLITKHGILIVDFADRQQEEASMPVMEAITAAAVLRLRPILMTTGAMVLGALPLALASGAGAESRQQIGWIILGGMSFGTLFTLFVVPVVYSLIVKAKSSASAVRSAD